MKNEPGQEARSDIDGPRRAPETAERGAKRLGEGVKVREAGGRAEDANIQRMIERSIKDHGA